MSVIIILLTVSICIAGAFLAAFLWSVKDGQFDDQQSPAQRILFDNELVSTNPNQSKHINKQADDTTLPTKSNNINKHQ